MKVDREAANRWQREYRAKTGNACTKKYEKTPKGFLMRTYRNMLSRVKGIQKKKAHLYEGKPILSREEFYGWSRKNRDFWRLYHKWVRSGFDRKICPSIDRIDSDGGYTLDNMQWITFSENCSRSSETKRQRRAA